MNNTNLKIKAFPELTKELFYNDLVKEYLFFGVWKKVHSSHFDYKKLKGISKLSSYMGCSHSETRRMIKRLFELNWVTEDKNGKDLRFVSNKKLFAQFGLKEKQYGQNIRYVGKDTVYVLLSTIANQNLDQQRHQLTENITTVGKDLTKVFKENKAAALFVLHNERNVKSFRCNSDVTVTRAGISKMSNKSSVSSGTNAIKKCRELGIVKKDNVRMVKISDSGDSNCLNALDSSAFINGRGELWMQLPNEVEFDSVSSFNDKVGGLISKVKKNANVSFKYNAPFTENMLELFANMDQRTGEYNYYSQRGFSLDKCTKDFIIINKSNPLYDIYLNKSLANKN